MRADRRPFVERIHWIAGQLRSGRHINCSAIARRFEISTKTAMRDIDFLRDRLRYDIDYDEYDRTFTLLRAPEPVL
jgi:predicted DNA-binding transcriptional regulator YafY